MTNVTYARQGTESNQILWVIEWAGAGWYAGANEVTYKLEATSRQEAEAEARSKGLGTPTWHPTERSLNAAHGNNW